MKWDYFWMLLKCCMPSFHITNESAFARALIVFEKPLWGKSIKYVCMNVHPVTSEALFLVLPRAVNLISTWYDMIIMINTLDMWHDLLRWYLPRILQGTRVLTANAQTDARTNLEIGNWIEDCVVLFRCGISHNGVWTPGGVRLHGTKPGVSNHLVRLGKERITW